MNKNDLGGVFLSIFTKEKTYLNYRLQIADI